MAQSVRVASEPVQVDAVRTAEFVGMVGSRLGVQPSQAKKKV